MAEKHPHSSLIDLLGGTGAVAQLCEVQPPSVSEWRYSGIPRARLKFLQLARPDAFEPREAATEPANAIAGEVANGVAGEVA